MNPKQKVYLISFIILILCLIAAGVFYFYTGDLIIALFIAPPIIYWILQKRHKEKYN